MMINCSEYLMQKKPPKKPTIFQRVGCCWLSSAPVKLRVVLVQILHSRCSLECICKIHATVNFNANIWWLWWEITSERGVISRIIMATFLLFSVGFIFCTLKKKKFSIFLTHAPRNNKKAQNTVNCEHHKRLELYWGMTLLHWEIDLSFLTVVKF